MGSCESTSRETRQTRRANWTDRCTHYQVFSSLRVLLQVVRHGRSRTKASPPVEPTASPQVPEEAVDEEDDDESVSAQMLRQHQAIIKANRMKPLPKVFHTPSVNFLSMQQTVTMMLEVNVRSQAAMAGGYYFWPLMQQLVMPTEWRVLKDSYGDYPWKGDGTQFAVLLGAWIRSKGRKDLKWLCHRNDIKHCAYTDGETWHMKWYDKDQNKFVSTTDPWNVFDDDGEGASACWTTSSSGWRTPTRRSG
ncbi:unnamed protein product [Vitrella brassicaformis CCMP3155]|uniref:Uncharacterized protein n=1 Tax=Vitrella brassicaformis (strain CCMP3155) TaxID=1169540 RepID=A0A0G4H5F5_VITBC|nr:unnamed protein product [Vitrella brassicaformis CCMP3155]|eukprot:CEM39003.1 unnamed protein product [Vitrella brassicaformis CCMP3155]